jgi:acyl-CoA synthetase (AMP-forming)/AMP-acid ligase II
MIELLERAAGASPSHTAVVTSESSASYGELLDDARRIATALQDRGLKSIAIVERDAAWVLRLLAGAALAGSEPCQYQADISASEFAAQAPALGHDAVVTRRADLVGPLEVIEPADLVGGVESAVDRPSGAQPVVIRTTGTTGVPKAARYDWRLLARTVERVEPRPEQRWLLAYGPHQFAGIQVLQHVLAAQATLVAPFPRQPRDGLAALLDDGVTCVSATPTYWRFLLAEARSAGATLPPLEQITLGGEASPGDLLVELRTAFPAARISHVYASTEFGSVASVRDGRAGFPEETLFSDSNPEAHVRVVDGELWVRAKAGMLGYAGEMADAAAGSGAAQAEDRAEAEWHPTGDLVEIVDGRVLFRGRTSEVINVGGVKVHPLPVENKIAALERIAIARVFGRPNRLTGAIVAAEVVPVTGVTESDHDELREEIRAAVADLPRPWHPRSITFVEAIETRGAKTVRGSSS